MLSPFFEFERLGALGAVEVQSIQVALFKSIQIIAGKGFRSAVRTQRFFVFIEARNTDKSLTIRTFFQLVPQRPTHPTLQVCVIDAVGGPPVIFVDEFVEFSVSWFAFKLGE